MKRSPTFDVRKNECAIQLPFSISFCISANFLCDEHEDPSDGSYLHAFSAWRTKRIAKIAIAPIAPVAKNNTSYGTAISAIRTGGLACGASATGKGVNEQKKKVGRGMEASTLKHVSRLVGKVQAVREKINGVCSFEIVARVCF